MGPVLSDVGYRRSSGFLRQTLLDPQSTLVEGFLYVEVVTKGGKHISGMRMNEDTYSIQVRDLSDQMYSFWKTELTQLHKYPKRTPMPGFKNALADAEIEDLIAYLTSLRGAQ